MTTPSPPYFEPIAVYDNVNPRIVELYDGETHVLDIGCGSGALAARLRKLNPRAVIDGIDISAAAGEQARPRLNGFLELDLDRDSIPTPPQRYDLVVLGDILEHLRRPDLLLEDIRQRLLSPSGGIILSVPNVAQMRIRRKLLMGRFDYTDTGILDRSHLRFFTYRTITDLIAQTGFRIETRRFITARWKGIDRWLYRLVARQFVFKVRPQ